MNKKGKLELTWVGKDERVRLEPRVLVEDPEKSYGDPKSENMLIYGDNLLALKALEQDFAGKVKCIYIDPPYNTGAAFSQYDDGIEHSIWLSLMRDRLDVLRGLLKDDGAIFVQIDDNEGHYLKVMMDEIFGRKNFITTFIWQKVDSPNDNKVAITPDHEFILCYAKDQQKCVLKQKEDASVLEAYGNRDENGRPFRDRLLKKNGKSSMREDRPSMFFPITGPDGINVLPIHDDGREARWALGKEGVDKLIESKELIWKNRGTPETPKWVPYTREYAPKNPVRPYSTIWTDVLTSRQAKAHQKELLPFGIDLFATPKTEQLISRILNISTSFSDIVLDSFAGSGTTGAVAHKMGRRWIMCELGEHCHTHIIPRLKKVIDGTDLGGISVTSKTKAAVKLCKACTELLCEKCSALVGENSAGGEQIWFGGGGFKYYRLAESLLVRDRDLSTKHHPVFVINPRYNEQMLIRAICKIEGFKYRNEGRLQGISSENRFLHVTTRIVTQPYLDSLADDLGPQQSLLLYSTKRSRRLILPDNVEIKKIPRDLLDRCDFQEEK